MIKNIRKYLEYLFFILVNIFLLGPVYILLLLPVPFISTQIAIKICKVPKYLIDSFDAKEIYTGVLIGNERAKNLYTSFGFVETGIIEDNMIELKYICKTQSHYF